jgi:hypothetical protein
MELVITGRKELMKNKFCDMFTTEDYNALYTALHEAAEATYDETGKLYDYIEGAPRTSLVCELIHELNNLGYKIVKK